MIDPPPSATIRSPTSADNRNGPEVEVDDSIEELSVTALSDS